MAEWVKKTSLPLIDRLKEIEAGFEAVLAEYLKQEAERIEYLAKVLAEHQRDLNARAQCSEEEKKP